MTESKIITELKKALGGEARFDPITKRAYSVDASIYEIEPLGIITPKSKEDILKALQIAKEFQLPVIPRGAATGITGGCIGKGLVLDLSKHMNSILTINYEEEYAICEPGVVQDQLNGALSKRGYRLGPDTSTGNRATIGGMLANNAAGSRSLRYGKMSDHIEEVELALASGEFVKFHPVDEFDRQIKTSLNNSEGHIYREVFRIKSQYGDEIRARFPKLPRRVSGYNLDELLKPGPLNISRLIAGSEGSLGIATEVKLKICLKPKVTGLCIVHFSNMIDGMHSLSQMLAFHPLSLEMIDDKIIEMGRQSPAMKGKLGWLTGAPQAVFVAEFEAPGKGRVEEQLHAFEDEMKKHGIGNAYTLLTDPAEMNHVIEVRKAGLGLLLSKRTYSRAIAFIEDISVAPQNLGPFMAKFLEYMRNAGKDAGIYGHVGSGCMHIRPYIDLRQQEELELMRRIMMDVSDMLLEHGGALSGEHGDGLIRSWLNEKMFGEKLYRAFCELKGAFDPENRMNPGKVVNGPPLLQNLRMDPSVKQASIPTFQDFSAEGGFELAADLCNGNALCRKSEKVMCPSFQASKDEFDTTRARAQALRAVINARLPVEDFTSKKIYDVLDLCLECKGCKTECPSQVDMAKMKSEFLYHYQEKHGYSLRSRLFGQIGEINRLASPFGSLFNLLGASVFTKAILNWLGIAPQRDLPRIAGMKFSKWLQLEAPAPSQAKKVMLFNDTFTEFNQPEIGQAALTVLRALGYDVIVPQWRCCGRPLLSKGMLKQAQEKAIQLVDMLFEYAKEGIPIIGLEPSCLLTIKDDLHSLFNKEHLVEKAKVEQIQLVCKTFDEFVSDHVRNGALPLAFKPQNKPVKVHGHCHQKSLVGTSATLNVLKAVPGFNVSEIDSGCCGMAGSFGYEKEHYAFSMKIGELRLFPALRESPLEALIVADGMSCRSQISHGVQRQALHLAQVLADAMESPPR